MGDGHAKYGVVPAGGATVRLVERIGRGHAARLFYTAELVDVGTLADWGLVDEIVPKDELMARAAELAASISAASPEVLRHVKALTSPARDAERQSRLRAELDRFRQHIDGADLAEGLAAFREKRRPVYREGR